MTALAHHTDYRQGLEDIKRRIQSAQTRAVLAANTELLQLYWDIGRQLAQWQKERDWGTAVVEQMATDLQSTYPGIKGFSRPSLFAMRQFYAFCSPLLEQFESASQPVRQIPWGHIRTLLVKVKDVDEALLYAQACVDNCWSRSVLTLQIEQRYH